MEKLDFIDDFLLNYVNSNIARGKDIIFGK